MKIKKPEFKNKTSDGRKIRLPEIRKIKKPELGKIKMPELRKKKEDPNLIAKMQDEPAFTFGVPEEETFEVNVRNTDPFLKRLDKSKTVAAWISDAAGDLACGCVVMSVFVMFLLAAEAPELIPFAIPGIVIYMAVATIGNRLPGKARLITAAVGMVLAIAALIILRKYIGNGFALLTGQLYDSAEEAQAYIYDRFPIGTTGEEHPHRSMHMAVLWSSYLVGLLTALPPAGARRGVCLGVASIAMISFAYYGLIPSWICIAVMTAAIVIVLARENYLPVVPVLLVVMIVFGAIMFIDPGESYGISRADEKFRDRFALKSAYLENAESSFDGSDIDEDDFDEDLGDQDESDGEGIFGDSGGTAALITIIMVVAAIAAAVYLFIRRLRNRQRQNRAGLNSPDDREAVVAMFPYAVRWLQADGLDIAGKSFTSLLPQVRKEKTSWYAERFESMYDLWKEAAYSDHEITINNRNEMDNFLRSTVSMVKENSDLFMKLRNTIKYAL